MAAATAEMYDAAPVLLDILQNSLILHQLAPYIPIKSKLALAASSTAVRHVLLTAPETFRYLDLSGCRRAIQPSLEAEPIDPGGINWRSQRMDEALTPDEFYSGPLRGIFSSLERLRVLKHVQVLILDGLSVTAELVADIISEDRFSVRILSVRRAPHLNDRKLMQVLNYAVRPTRPEGTPRLKGIYVFQPLSHAPPTLTSADVEQDAGVMSSEGAQIGAAWNYKSRSALRTDLNGTADVWYQKFGRIFNRCPGREWADTIKACEGIIAFDAVLCRGPQHDVELIRRVFQGHDASLDQGREGKLPARMVGAEWLPPAVAGVALGPEGCSSCRSCHEGPARFGESPSHHLPLLGPPPTHSSSIAAAQKPHTNLCECPRLIVRCENCLGGRWCERCLQWWDEPCYAVVQARKAVTTRGINEEELDSLDPSAAGDGGSVQDKAGVSRDCYDCGFTCIRCKRVMKICRSCRGEYCVDHADGCTATECDWCSNGRRHTREMF